MVDVCKMNTFSDAYIAFFLIPLFICTIKNLDVLVPSQHSVVLRQQTKVWFGGEGQLRFMM